NGLDGVAGREAPAAGPGDLYRGRWAGPMDQPFDRVVEAHRPDRAGGKEDGRPPTPGGAGDGEPGGDGDDGDQRRVAERREPPHGGREPVGAVGRDIADHRPVDGTLPSVRLRASISCALAG